LMDYCGCKKYEKDIEFFRKIIISDIESWIPCYKEQWGDSKSSAIERYVNDKLNSLRRIDKNNT
jgi:hypothetical protein